MTAVELRWKSAGAGKHFAKNQANTEGKKIGPPGENAGLLVVKKENKTGGGAQYEKMGFKML
jgi:hypothetical protein